uniref:Tetratricopeptide repeat protein n=1 Tax=Cryptomonas curvata TaxID=233186 RepID=A0A7S0M2G7_9CRYP|mmetsp:Transcript_21588/g.45401  ORF Transcript_21588/g.45401 Transcript_21588/m.45401 type:complete len:261 (+) Transcript_21588:14-796(+)
MVSNLNEQREVDNERRPIDENVATARCDHHGKSMHALGHSVGLVSCRIMLKNCDVNNQTTLLGSVINILPDSNVEVRLDGREDTLIVGLECIRPVDAGSAVELAKSFFESGFKAASIKIVQILCADYLSTQDLLLHVSYWLIGIGEHQEAETMLHKALKLDPSVTSGDHLRAMCALAELKSLLGLHDEAICLLEAVLQNDPDARSEHTASALLNLDRAYTELGEVGEARRIRALLQRATDARAGPSAGEDVLAGALTLVE